MARPKKQTVDYFPHYCNGSRSLFILQSQHGNDGYAFWFKLLQILGKTEGHVFDYNNPDNWLFLITETHVPEDKAAAILETLATVGSIDKELWHQKIIWSQNFVDNVADVYMRRKVEKPLRPGSSRPAPAATTTEAIDPDDLKVAGMIKYYEENAGRMLTPNDLMHLNDFADTYKDGWFEKAVDEAVKNKARAPIRYIETIMESWKVEGVNPFDERKRRGRTEKVGDTSTQALKDSTTGPID